MALTVPFADWVPLGRQTERKMLGHNVICLHTMVGYLISTDRMWRPDGYTGIESHFGVGGAWGPDAGLNLDGKILQWQDLAYEADANLNGNSTVISVETADNAGKVILPWSNKQVAALIRLLDYLCSPEAHSQCPSNWACHNVGIPRQLIPDTKPSRRGIGYHRQGIKGNYPDGIVPGGVKWSNATGKTCPTDSRIWQIKQLIIPALNRGEDEEEVAYYTVYSAPNKPPRVFVDGAVVGFPNPVELAEYLKPFDKAGYERKNVNFAEVDDWQRFMDGHFARDDQGNMRLIDVQNRLTKLEEASSEPQG